MEVFGQWCSCYSKTDCLILLLYFASPSLGKQTFDDGPSSFTKVCLRGYCFSSRSLMVVCNLCCSCHCSWTQLALGYSVHYFEHGPHIQVNSSKYARYHSKNCGDHRWELGMEPASRCLQFNLGEDHSTPVVHSTKYSGRQDVIRDCYSRPWSSIKYYKSETEKLTKMVCKPWTESWELTK